MSLKRNKSILESAMSDDSIFKIILWEDYENFIRKEWQRRFIQLIRDLWFTDFNEFYKDIEIDWNKLLKLFAIQKEQIAETAQNWVILTSLQK